MKITEFFSQLRLDISHKKFDKLKDYTLNKPQKFSWVKDIFYPMNVKTNPTDTVLIWRYNV